jgi:hypothetical protein
MNVKPHKIPCPNNTIGEVTQLAVSVVFDNLVNKARFSAELKSKEDIVLSMIFIDVDPILYKKWTDSAPDYALGAHQICAEALGLELV